MTRLRQSMPVTAEIVDELRLQFGRVLIDDALRNGIALEREHQRRRELNGDAAAKAWLDAQNPEGAFFRAVECRPDGALTIGALPGCAPSVLTGRKRPQR